MKFINEEFFTGQVLVDQFVPYVKGKIRGLVVNDPENLLIHHFEFNSICALFELL
jgi:hypothetical protein